MVKWLFSARKYSTRRSIRNLVAFPHLQYKMTSAFVFLGLGFISLLSIVSYLLSRSLIIALSQNSALTNGDLALIEQFAKTTSFTYLAIFISLIIVSALTAFLMSHRIFGPIVAIKRHIDRIKSGDLEFQTRLRENDLLKPIAEELNELSRHLAKNRSDSPSKTG